MCHPKPDASKKVKFSLSRNSTKFDWVIRFREMIPTVQSVSLSAIYTIYMFPIEITVLPFFEKIEFLSSFTIIIIIAKKEEIITYSSFVGDQGRLIIMTT